MSVSNHFGAFQYGSSICLYVAVVALRIDPSQVQIFRHVELIYEDTYSENYIALPAILVSVNEKLIL